MTKAHENKVRDLTEGRPMRLIISFAAPLLFGFLFQQLYSFVDTALVGRFLGADKLAAVGATGSVNFLVLGFCNGFCSGFAIPVAQAFGAKDHKALKQSVAQAVYLCAGLSLGMAALTGALCPWMLRVMDTPEAILPGAVSYIRIIFLTIPLTVLYSMAGGILRSLGDSRTPVVFLVAASLINIALDILFILVFRMDVAGAAVATAISQGVSGLGCVIVIVKRYPLLRLSRDDWRFRPALAGKLLGTGVPMGLQFSITAIGSVILQTAVNGLGVSAVAAIATASKISMCLVCVFDALATTMATFAGQNMSAGKISRIREGIAACAKIGVVYSLAAFALSLAAAQELIGLFLDTAKEAEVTALAVRFLHINTAFYVPLLFIYILRLAIQGMGYTRVAMIAGVFEMGARIAVALVLVPALGFTGACLANPAAWVMADVFLFPCCRRILFRLQARAGEPDKGVSANAAENRVLPREPRYPRARAVHLPGGR